MQTDNRLYFTFPGGARRAVTLSFDDGTIHDRRLVEAFGRHGLKATFNLVPGRFGRDGVVSRDEVASLYAGHEVASHGWMHLNLDYLDPYRRLAEIRDGRAALEDLLGRPVRGFASPYGAHGNASVDAMREAGVAYARTAGSTNDARWPVPDFLRWTMVSHERRALPLVEGALAGDGWGGTLKALALWGHGYEFEDRWDDLEALCAALGGRKGVWYATNIELVDYWNACMAVRSSLDGTIVQNLAAIPVHASWGPDHGAGEGAVPVVLAPGQALDLRTLAPPKGADPVVRILSTEEYGENGEKTPADARHPSLATRHSGPLSGPALCWPGFRRKAVTFSYDDGMRNDRRLVALLNRHGLRGTFNLNSGKLSPDGAADDAWNVRASEAASLYAGTRRRSTGSATSRGTSRSPPSSPPTSRATASRSSRSSAVRSKAPRIPAASTPRARRPTPPFARSASSTPASSRRARTSPCPRTSSPGRRRRTTAAATPRTSRARSSTRRTPPRPSPRSSRLGPLVRVPIGGGLGEDGRALRASRARRRLGCDEHRDLPLRPRLPRAARDARRTRPREPDRDSALPPRRRPTRPSRARRMLP